MQPAPFRITLKAPSTVRVVDYNGKTKCAYVSAVALRSQMHRTLKLLIDEYSLPADLEIELFGELRHDGFARASAFRISGALCKCGLPVFNGDPKEKVVLPAGGILEGFLQTDLPSNSPSGLAVFMSLLGVRSMKSETTSNDVACVVSADTSSIELKEQ